MNPSWRPLLRELVRLGLHGSTQKQVIERLAEERLTEMVASEYFKKARAMRRILPRSSSTRSTK